MVKTTHFQITNFHITSIKKLQSPGIYKFVHTWEWKKNQIKPKDLPFIKRLTFVAKIYSVTLVMIYILVTSSIDK